MSLRGSEATKQSNSLAIIAIIAILGTQKHERREKRRKTRKIKAVSVEAAIFCVQILSRTISSKYSIRDALSPSRYFLIVSIYLGSDGLGSIG